MAENNVVEGLYGENPLDFYEKMFSFVEDTHVREQFVLSHGKRAKYLNFQTGMLELQDSGLEALLVPSELLLADGGDDRLSMDERKNFQTKYFATCFPRDIIRRGSCTCTTTNSEEYSHSTSYRIDLIKNLLNGTSLERVVEDEMNSIRVELADLFGLTHLDEFDQLASHIILFPSGSDAELFPTFAGLALSHTFSLKSSVQFIPKVYNIITAAGEVGSGTASAAGARHLSYLAPRGDNVLLNGRLLNGSGSQIEILETKARNNRGDLFFDESSIALKIKSMLEENVSTVVVVHLVYGSKTGLIYPSLLYMEKNSPSSCMCETPPPVLDIALQHKDRVFLVVDMCQLRSGFDSIRKFSVEYGAAVLFTGSKFFCGPAFSGGIVVPKYMANAVESYLSHDESGSLLSDDLTMYLTPFEIPPSMPKFRNYLSSVAAKDNQKWMNIGLMMRWNLALCNMRKFCIIPKEVVNFLSQSWIEKVRAYVHEFEPILRLLPTSEYAISSIISIGIMVPYSTGNGDIKYRSVSRDEMKQIHYSMTVGDAPHTMLGQAVKLCESDGSNDTISCVIRIALGADMIIKLCDGLFAKDDQTFTPAKAAVLFQRLDLMLVEDLSVVKKLRAIALSMSPVSIDKISKIDSIFGALTWSPSKTLSTSPPFSTVNILSQVLAQLSNDRMDMENTAIFYDLNSLQSNVDLLRHTFDSVIASDSSATFHHCFAVKSCPVSFVVRAMIKMGLGLETASIMEVHHGLSMGCPAERIVFDSPCKTYEEILFAMKNNVLLNANSFAEFEKIKEAFSVLQSQGKKSFGSIGIRINPLLGAGSIKELSTATLDSKFGIPFPQMMTFVDGMGMNTLMVQEWNEWAILQRQKVLNLFLEHSFVNGVMCHVGSQGMAVTTMVEGARVINELADMIDSMSEKQQIKYIDIGGGLSVNYLSDEVCPTFQDYASLLKERIPSLFLSNRRIITEFGKAIVSKSAMIATKVEDVLFPPFVKTLLTDQERDLQKAIAICHAGADLMLRTAYCRAKFPHRLHLLSDNGKPPTDRTEASVTIAGPLCFSGDILDEGLLLPCPQAGDWIVVSDAGANTISLFSRHCSRQSPACYCFYQPENSKGHFMIEKIRDTESKESILGFWTNL